MEVQTRSRRPSPGTTSASRPTPVDPPAEGSFKLGHIEHVGSLQPGAVLQDQNGNFYDVLSADYKTPGFRFLCRKRTGQGPRERWVAMSSIMAVCRLVVMK